MQLKCHFLHFPLRWRPLLDPELQKGSTRRKGIRIKSKEDEKEILCSKQQKRKLKTQRYLFWVDSYFLQFLIHKWATLSFFAGKLFQFPFSVFSFQSSSFIAIITFVTRVEESRCWRHLERLLMMIKDGCGVFILLSKLLTAPFGCWDFIWRKRNENKTWEKLALKLFRAEFSTISHVWCRKFCSSSMFQGHKLKKSQFEKFLMLSEHFLHFHPF